MNYYTDMPGVAQAENNEYHVLRRHGRAVGICLVLYALLQELSVTVLVLAGLADEYASNPAFQYAAGIIISFISLLLPFFVFSFKRGSLSYWQVLPFNAPAQKGLAAMIVAAGFAVCLASNYVAAFAEALLGGIGVDVAPVESLSSSSAVDVFMNYLCAAVAAPVAEEFVFRGVIMQPLRRYGEHFAVFTSALLFGLAHGNPTSFVFAFVSGVILGYAVLATQSLWVGMAIHAVNNFYAVTSQELYASAPDFAVTAFDAFSAVAALCGLVLLIVLICKGVFRLRRPCYRLSAGRRAAAFWLCIPMLLAVAAFLFYFVSSIE